MRVLSTSQLRQSDAFTIAQGIASVDLMEQAAWACFEFIEDFINPDQEILILTGNGNNGGDGWAIARMLYQANYKTSVICTNNDALSNDAEINKQRFIEVGGTWRIYSSEDEFFSADIIIEALLGSGLSRPIEGKFLEIAKAVNNSRSLVFSVDSPSGFFTEQPMPEGAIAVEADFTLSFHSPRLMFFFPESQVFLGAWHVLDIGLQTPQTNEFSQDSIPYSYTLVHELKPIIKNRNAFSHKGNFGHALLIGGSRGKYGAMVLAGKACLKSGAGLTSLIVPSDAVNIMQSALPEAMCIASDASDIIQGNFNLEKASAIGFGPGAGTNEATAKTLKAIIQQGIAQLVIDADGLNILSENKTWLAFLPVGTILTPHPGEMDRLTEKADSTYNRLQNAKELSRKFSVIVVLKGAYTAVCFPSGEVHFNSTGNPGMAKGGSGDALTGIITALLAQGYSNSQAAILGVALHGLAGDIAASEFGEFSMLPSELIHCLGDAFSFVQE